MSRDLYVIYCLALEKPSNLESYYMRKYYKIPEKDAALDLLEV